MQQPPNIVHAVHRNVYGFLETVDLDLSTFRFSSRCAPRLLIFFFFFFGGGGRGVSQAVFCCCLFC